MSRTLFHANIDQVDWVSDVIRMLLVRSTSAYTPDPDHVFLDAFTGGGGAEISVASYGRQTLGTKARTVDNTNNLLKFTSADVDFGTLESGQTALAILIYRQVGGDDTTPANDEMLLYDDGKIDVQLYLEAAISATTLTVFPLKGAVPSSTALDFGGGATGTVSGLHAAGARQILLSGGGLAAGAAVDSIDTNVGTTNPMPQALLGGSFAANMPTNGWFRKRLST